MHLSITMLVYMVTGSNLLLQSRHLYSAKLVGKTTMYQFYQLQKTVLTGYCVYALPNTKSPGPDGILKHLPEDAKQAIPKVFILMWMTGGTPTSWKESCTVLIHKKGAKHDLGDWRPIALANLPNNSEP